MKVEIKEIIDELIFFKKERKPMKYLVEVEKKIGFEEVYTLSGGILAWNKRAFKNMEFSNKYDLNGNQIHLKRYQDFFKEFSEMNKLFTLKEGCVVWAENINEEEQKEIIDYINENHKVLRRIGNKKTWH